MAAAPFQTVHISEVPVETEFDGAGWRPVRRHFGILSFGASAYLADVEGQHVVPDHTEADDSGTRHEELFLVASGRATFTIEGEEVDAPAGTFLYVREPAVRRSAVAREAGTAVFAVGGTPGEAFAVSPWERKYDPASADD